MSPYICWRHPLNKMRRLSRIFTAKITTNIAFAENFCRILRKRAAIMRYIHESPDWPTFQWDIAKLAEQLAAIRHKQGLLLGRMSALGFSIRAEAGLEILTLDVVKSSAIEGESLDVAQVRSSLARRLGIDIGALMPPNRSVEGVVEMMLDATQRLLNRLQRNGCLAGMRRYFLSDSGHHDVSPWARGASQKPGPCKLSPATSAMGMFILKPRRQNALIRK